MVANTINTEARSNHYKRLGRYSDSKKRTIALSQYIRKNHPELKKVADNLSACGDYLTYRHYYETDEWRLIRGNSCDKHLLCGICAARRSARQYYRYRQAYKNIIAENDDLRVVFFTLTIKNGENLAERYQHLYSSMAALSQKKRNAAKGKTTTAFSLMQGAVWSYEVTNRGRGWHPHIHGIGLISRGQSAKSIETKLKAEWEEITGDSHQLVVQFPKNTKNEDKAFFEVFKYSLKFGELSFKHQVEIYKTLSGRRMMASNGLFYGIKNDETENGEEIEREFYDLLYKYDRISGKYQLHHVEHFASSMDTSRPKAALREYDLLRIQNPEGWTRWDREMMRYCEKNGLNYKKSRTCSSTICLRKKRNESVNGAGGRNLNGQTMSGYPLLSITAEQ